MAMNDPIGDMLTRIRNAADAPPSEGRGAGVEAARPRARRAGRGRLHPRLCAHRAKGGVPEFEIELKYYNGQPAIKEIAASPSRAVASIRRSRTCRRRERPRRRDPVDAQRRDVGCRAPARRTSAAKSSAAYTNDGAASRPVGEGFERTAMSRIGKKPVAVPSAVTATVDGQTIKMKGPKGELTFDRARRDQGREDGGRDRDSRPRRDQGRAAMWGMARTLVANMVKGVTRATRARCRSRASVSAPP